ncbi:MAG: hypothetical protein AAFY43_11600 [Pseudomonadota bacterium]
MPKETLKRLGEHSEAFGTYSRGSASMLIHQALAEGETSGPAQPFDRRAFQAEMKAKYDRKRSSST